MRLALGSLAWAVVFVGGVSFGEESDGQKHFQMWRDQALGGVWSTAREDGTVRIAAHTLVANGKFIQTAYRDENGSNTGSAMWGVNPKTGKFQAWYFFRDGTVAESLMTPTEKGWDVQLEGWRPEAGHGTIKSKILVVDKDTHIWTRVEVIDNGENIGVTRGPLKWTRKKTK